MKMGRIGKGWCALAPAVLSALAFWLAGCGGTSTQSGPGSNPGQPATPPPTGPGRIVLQVNLPPGSGGGRLIAETYRFIRVEIYDGLTLL